jgi:hypothetical protein
LGEATVNKCKAPKAEIGFDVAETHLNEVYFNQVEPLRKMSSRRKPKPGPACGRKYPFWVQWPIQKNLINSPAVRPALRFPHRTHEPSLGLDPAIDQHATQWAIPEMVKFGFCLAVGIDAPR